MSENLYANLVDEYFVLDNRVKELEYEGKFKSFFVLPPLDERADNSELLQRLLSSLGIINY